MMMEHIAMVTRDAERLKDFYVKYFDGKAECWGDENVKLYFISFGNETRLELEERKHAADDPTDREATVGIAHIAFMATSKKELIEKTAQIEKDGYTIRLQPKAYGDDFFESCFLDPDGNIIEISVGPEYLKKEVEEEKKKAKSTL